LPAPAISHVIGTTGLIVLIFVMPYFYYNVVDNVQTDVITRELKELTDYTSNTIENLYFLINSTNSNAISLEKELVYLPSTVENAFYSLEIVSSDNKTASYLRATAYTENNKSIIVNSWLIPGLNLDQENVRIYSSEKTVVVGCSRQEEGVNVWITYA
jgi:hypothetical protein